MRIRFVRCPLCDDPRCACGQRTTSEPIDRIAREVTTVTGALKIYEVEQPDGTVARLKLSEADAKTLGVLNSQSTTETKAAEPPANKARSSSTKTGSGNG